MKEKSLFFSLKILLLLFTISIIEIKSQVSLYTFGSSPGTYSSISTGTNLYTGTWNDGVANNIPIGFNFYFNGKDYSTCSVSTNGFISLGTTAPSNTEYSPISNNTMYEASISALGINLAGNSGSTISYITQGTAPNRSFIVQYSNVRRYNVSGDAFSFQIRLNETSNTVEFIYGSFTVSNSINSIVQVGLRGFNNNDFNNRSYTGTALWNTSTISGTSNSSTVRLRSTVYPSSGRTFTWTPPPVCSGNPSVTGVKSQLYINNFQFVGVLNSTPANTSGFSSTGYENYTGITPAQQPQGSVINISASRGSSNGSNGYWKAWVDWNNDGDFDFSSEEVYSLLDYTTPSLTFGFIIPFNQPVGNYKLRIATANSSANFSPCASNITIGEFEDYLFTVVKDCSAKVISVNTVNEFDGERCGPGSVRLSAKGTASAVNFNWYDYDSLTNTYIYKATGITYNTDVLTSTHTFYVKAITNNDIGAGDYCETAFYYPVDARIDPNPTVTFSTNKPAICGEDDPTLLVTASGDKYQDVIFEKFDSGLGVFSNITEGASFTDPSNGNNISNWLNKPSPYQPKDPPYQGLSPALSSGYFGDNFAMMNTDIARNSTSQIIINHLLSEDLNITGYNDLHIDFNLYYFSIATNDDEGFIKAEYQIYNSSTGTWSSWTELLKKNNSEEANPLYWEKFSFDITSVLNLNTTALRIRFTMKSYSGDLNPDPNITSNGFIEGITAIDNVRIYGFKTINTPFKWNSAATTIYDTDCVTPLPINDLRSTVCVKPTPTELENLNWNLHANATFSNGCPADGYYDVNNDTKTWRQPGIIDWNQGAQWRPTSVPTISKCVIVRTPVELPTNTNGSHGLARSVIVKPGGSLIIQPKSSLTIQNHIKNETAASDVIVESDANLKQNSDAAINSGNITVYRNAQLKRLDYNYWGTPVTGQNVRNFSTNTLTNRFYVYREKDDFFDGVFSYSSYSGFTIADAFPLQSAATYTFELGKGYAIRAPNDFTNTVTNFSGAFLGVPNNGVVNIPIVCSSCSVLPPAKGNNLISNPYPSNIDFEQVYTLNSGLIYNTYFVWTNTNYNPKMQGENYPGTGIINNYALYNAIGGLTAPYGFTGLGTNTPVTPASPPNRYIKVGQGFIVKAKGNGTLTLNNSMRSTDNTAIFFNRMGSNEQLIDRFWLSLKTPLDFVSPILIGYKKGASNRYEMDYDAEHVVIGSDSFYSLLDDKKLAIQGRYPFQIEDSIPLGTNYYESGIHTISLDRAEGVFANGQNIYLKDNYTGVVTNLSQSPYRFTADAGEVKNRFEILYTNRTLGSSQVNQKEPFVIYKEDNAFVINANEVITLVKLFDVTGKLVNEQKVGYKSTKIFFTEDLKGVFLLEIITPTKRYTHKVIN